MSVRRMRRRQKTAWQFLSASLPQVSVPQGGPAMMVAAWGTAAAVEIIDAVGNYSCTANLKVQPISNHPDKEPGLMVLKITSQRNTAVSGSLYSMDWGGFNVAVSGTIDANGTLTLKGSDKTFALKKLTAQVAARAATITGSCSLVQMGIVASATVKLIKLSKAPPPATPAKAPSLVGSYKGTAYDDNGGKLFAGTLAITKQDGGHIWAKDGGGTAMTGVVLKDGRFRFVTIEKSGHTEFTGQVQKNGALSASWKLIGQPTSGGGTFEARRVSTKA